MSITQAARQSCWACDLRLGCVRVTTGAIGQPILVIAEYPSREDEASGQPLSDPTSMPMHELLERYLSGQYTVTYLYACRPPLLQKEQSLLKSPCPSLWLPPIIEEHPPLFIITLGKRVTSYFIPLDRAFSEITGQFISSPLPFLKNHPQIRIGALPHPFLLKNPEDENRAAHLLYKISQCL